MDINLCPSMMCARYGKLDREIGLLEDAGADILHLDVMDGQYVANFGMGLQDIQYICSHTKIRTELHLMIRNPHFHLDTFAACRPDIIYIHPESETHVITSLQHLEDMGVESGIVMNPGTSVESILELLNVARRVLVMGVNPGQAGQIYLPYAEKKIDKLLDLKETYGFSIGMDGACNTDHIRRLSAKGVENFVLGTAALFYGDMDYKGHMKQIYRAVGKEWKD